MQNVDLDYSEDYEFMRPLVEQWLRKVELARKSKSAFQAIGDQCHSFFSQACGFMWEDEYLKKYMGGTITKPKFRITVNKAFELVAIFGPYLFWKYPHRRITSPDPIELIPELFGADEPGMMEFQEAVQEEAYEQKRGQYRNRLMEKYLNYSQREQPEGGLASHAEMAITEGLIRGRGVLSVRAYQPPSSDSLLTGCFFEKVDDLFIDPDCRDPLLRDAKWIAIRRESADWELEDKFNLPRGRLKHLGKYESYRSQAANAGSEAQMHRRNGQTNDIIVWYEIWSKCGVGTRMNYEEVGQLRRMSPELHDAFDETVGDYAYLCIADGVPWPLNAPSGLIKRIEKDEEVAKLFRWRAADYGPEFPCWKDNRWPVCLLDFYRDSRSCWPIAPLAPALGELTSLNVLMAALVEAGYENRKSIIAYMSSAKKYVEGAFKSSDNPAFIELSESVGQNINEIVQYLNRPDMNKDIITAIDYLMDLFDKRTGLTEIHYAMNVGGTQSRTARDTAAKEEKASIRPEKMSGDVARFMSELAQLEKFLAGWVVEGRSLIHLLGRRGSKYWDQFIATEDPEVIVREMQAIVEASDVRRPNKERLTANLQQMLQFLFPVLKEYAEVTGDTGPLNEFLETFGESIDQDLRPWQLGPWQQQADPEMMELQKVMAQLEQMKAEFDVMKAQLDVQKSEMEIEKTRLETIQSFNQGEEEARAKQMERWFNFIQRLSQKRREDREKLMSMQEQNDVKIDFAKEMAKIKAKEAKQKPKPATNGAKG